MGTTGYSNLATRARHYAIGQRRGSTEVPVPLLHDLADAVERLGKALEAIANRDESLCRHGYTYVSSQEMVNAAKAALTHGKRSSPASEQA